MKIILLRPKEELQKAFLALQSPEDVAAILEIKYSTLVYHLFKVPLTDRYKQFQIPKKSGEIRTISAPISPLKILQRKLNYVLQQVYAPKPSVHGFVLNKNIVTNAQIHTKKHYVFNIDLFDFFPSINFGRVRGMLMAHPYKLNAEVATVLAQICCFDNQLPQGAPTSPIISNMLCAKMDSELQYLAAKNRCDYTRYADDITFSTFNKKFPDQIGKETMIDTKSTVNVGTKLEEIVHANGFRINSNKVRLQSYKCRQSVTGLTTNEFPNTKRKFIRQIRSMIYDWARYGLEAAQNKLATKYYKKAAVVPPFKNVLYGKIEFLGMVRGKNDALYQKYLLAFHKLDPDHTPSNPGEENVKMTYDAFISHASEDKEAFVKPLVIELEKRGLKIWYDEFSIDDGANIPLSINKGIADSNYGIAVFSKMYFKKKWPAEELAALTTRQIYLRRTIIPVWYKITVEDMAANAPLWASNKAPSFPNETIQKIANRLAKQLKIRPL